MRDYLPPAPLGPQPSRVDPWLVDCSRYRAWKRAEVLKAFVALETAAWGRRWAEVKAARAAIEALTGLRIEGPLRRELVQAARTSTRAAERSTICLD